MMLRHEKIMEMFPITNGIFYYINYQFPSALSITSSDMDLNFLTLYGLKTCAPIVHVIHQDMSVSHLTSSELERLASVILSTYKWKWDKLAALLSLEYSPIFNYSDNYHEELTDNLSTDSTRTPNITESTTTSSQKTGLIQDGGSERETQSTTEQSTRTDNLSEQQTRTDNLTENTTETIDTTRDTTRTDNLSESTTSSGENNLFGFNSVDAVGADTNASNNTRTNTGTVNNVEEDSGTIADTKSNTGTQRTDRTNTGTVGNSTSSSHEKVRYGGLTHATDDSQNGTGSKRITGTESNESTSERTKVREFSHLGNIGNLTSQQLINQEIELWRWNFIQQVLNDVKDFLTLPLYD